MDLALLLLARVSSISRGWIVLAMPGSGLPGFYTILCGRYHTLCKVQQHRGQECYQTGFADVLVLWILFLAQSGGHKKLLL